jgi:hypothetical protein
MPLRYLAEKLGKDICKSLLGLHALTGSYQTGKFFGFSKLTCWKTYMSSSQNILKAFKNLGELLDEETKKQLTNYVLDLYMKKRPSTVTTLAALRWHLFSRRQSESNKLPPTQKAFEQMLLRAYFTTLQWKSSHFRHYPTYLILMNLVGNGTRLSFYLSRL